MSQQLTLAARGSQDARRRRRVLTGIVGAALVYGIISCPPASAQAISPHGEYGLNPESAKCTACHAPHNAAASRLLAHEATTTVVTQSLFCYRCHGDLGPASGNAKASFDEGLPSGHRVEDSGEASPADLTNTCASCHDPHADSTTELRLPREAINGKTVDGADNTWCFACHDDQDSWYRSLDVGAYPALSAPMRAASGYPTTGTFPGSTVYATLEKNAHANIPAGTMTESGGAARVAGDCLWCHSGHRGVSEYDGLIARFNASTAELKDTRDGEYAEVCFRCHAPDGAVPAPDIASLALGDPVDSGHTIRTAGDLYAPGAPLPCYECHNPHGSSRNNAANISDTLGQNLDPRDPADAANIGASAEKVRAFCFSCHVTYDADADTGRPWAWDSTAASGAGAYVPVSTTAKVVGLNRNVAVGVNDLRIPMANGHNKADTTRSCYECHGDVHKPMSGTSEGGVECSICHSALNGMVDDTSTYHHVLDDPDWDQAPDTGGTYPTTTETLSCVSCHVDHSDYEPLPGKDAGRADGKAFSLRNDATVARPAATDTDEGLCLSCHTTERNRNTTGQKPNVITETKVWSLNATWWEVSPHNYDSPGQFNDGSTFRANCAKCHGTLQGTLSSGKFAVHFSSEQRLLNALGDPVQYEVNEEQMCFRCHSEVSDFKANNAAGTLLGDPKPATVAIPGSPYSWDWYGTQPMKKSNVSIYAMMSSDVNTNGHQTHVYSKKHLLSDEDEDQAYLSDPDNKHVECADCHNHHVVGLARHTWGTSNVVSAAIRGVTGQGFRVGTGVGLQALVNVNWPTDLVINSQLEWKGPNNGTSYSAYEYEICFKCHSSANAGLGAWGGKKPEGGAVDRWTNVARDFSVGNQSRHPIVATLDGKVDTDLDGSTTDESIIPGYSDTAAYGTSKVRAGQLADGTNLTPNIWQPGATMYCSDCHGNEDSSLPTDADYLEYAQGPHGSSVEFSLRGPNTWWPYDPDGQLWTLEKASVNDDNGSTSGDDPFCSNCHPNLQANNVHKRAAVHQSATCVRCHTLIPHGGGMSRLIGDADSNMPARYAYNNDKSYLFISSFTKASTSTEYSQANCSIANTTLARSSCTKTSGQWHRPAPTGPVGNQTGTNTWVGGTWENW